MHTPQAFTSYIDIAQVVLYAFWLFFAGLVFYLHRENKREGYPLENEHSPTARLKVRGFPDVPAPKLFRSHDGHVYSAPSTQNDRVDVAVAATPGLGTPFVPTGDPMRDGVGPASWADREDVPERGMSGQAIIMPLRKALAHSIAPEGPNPMGMRVVGCDGATAGRVVDIWIDEAESVIRYIEVELAGGAGTRLLPMTMVRVRGKEGLVKVASILASQFVGVPTIKAIDEVTKREEDRIMAYYAGGHLYATPSRMGPLL